MHTFVTAPFCTEIQVVYVDATSPLDVMAYTETGNVGVHCYFVARDSDGTYHTISGHALNGIGGPLVSSDNKNPQMPSDPGWWPINHTPDPDCSKTNALAIGETLYRDEAGIHAIHIQQHFHSFSASKGLRDQREFSMARIWMARTMTK